MGDFNTAPPSYTSEPGLGETILDDKTLTELNVDQKNVTEKEKLPDCQEILQADRLGTLYNPGCDPFYWTPASTPFATAFNTPNPISQEKLPLEGYPHGGMMGGMNGYFNFPNPQMQPHAYMMNAYGMPLQPVVGSNGTISQQPINVVVNANSTVNQSGENVKYCPKCRVGVIVRQQHRARQIGIVLLGILTSCCLCYAPCLCLRNNYIDKCSYCGTNYGHKGAKVEKIKIPKRKSSGCC